MKRILEKRRRWIARKVRVRRKTHGVASKPRATVYFSNKNIIAQIIDDEAGKTLVSASTLEKGSAIKGKNREAAKKIGSELAERAKGAGISTVVFDRNGYLYHGKVKDLADAMREKGLSL
jgi:large subunit ribosomal protein L18